MYFCIQLQYFYIIENVILFWANTSLLGHTVKFPTLFDSQSHLHRLSANFTCLTPCSDPSIRAAAQWCTLSVLEGLWSAVPGCLPSGWRVAAEAQDAEIKAARLLAHTWHWDVHGLIIQISRSSGGVGKIEMSVLFIIIKICLFLCSPLLSPHAHIPPPQSW